MRFASFGFMRQVLWVRVNGFVVFGLWICVYGLCFELCGFGFYVSCLWFVIRFFGLMGLWVRVCGFVFWFMS